MGDEVRPQSWSFDVFILVLSSIEAFPHSQNFNFNFTFSYISHIREKYTRTTKVGGLNDLRSAENVKDLHE